MSKTLKVLFASAEVSPLAKVGGLADVAGALPKALAALGHDVRIIMPKYSVVNDTKFGVGQPIADFQVPMDSWQEPARLKDTRIGQQVPVYLVENDKYFGRDKVYGHPDDVERFIFFCRAIMEVPKKIGWQPDIIHCNDWHTAIVPAWLHTTYRSDPFYAHCASVFTIHNLAYQGVFGGQYLALAGIDQGTYRAQHPEAPNTLNLMSEAILYSDVINTVSRTYAEEILTPEYGERLDDVLRRRSDRLYGILNGIDYDVFDPAHDPHLSVNYDASSVDKKVENKLALQRLVNLPADPGAPLIGTIGRLADQKGFDLIAAAIDPIIQELGAQFVLLGTGEVEYHRLFEELGKRYPSKAAIFLTFDADLAQKIYAGSDMFLMPSRFEPCGLGQMISLRYGTIPIVRSTGGLADTVHDYDPRTEGGNGFSFRHYNRDALLVAVTRACENFKHKNTWQKLMLRGMSEDFSWTASASKYVDLYQAAAGFHEQEKDGLSI